MATTGLQQTPSRAFLRPRSLSYQTTAGRRPPSDEAVARQAAVDALPVRGAFATDVSAAVEAAKSERDRFTLTQQLSAACAIDVTAYGRPAAYLRLEMVQA